ncbi:SUMF1/EgtB/PvdO family nonheme iron enzyme [Luteimonas viscosa]|uniref:SUMF1/EgtB/PvdO family nonheme iron enzyme n=1 Tax=Luteimonas viscosa TaxID=1132694 RepID=A0A5D4XLM5_9GAMM|nr:SUMF1/EgtB/PvdO family nonheme iron enzyme [Luteimonas viscosa]TYT25044.1 SUMF1/EgtB/PvdO family nonheme iron enzyme [Luteimonas viscosa]
MPSRKSVLRGTWIALAVGALCCAGCARDQAGPEAPGTQAVAADDATLAGGAGSVTISGDDSVAGSLTWQVPAVALEGANLDELRRKATAALADGHLHEDADAAIPIYLALSTLPEHSGFAEAGLRRALRLVLDQGDAALADAGDDPVALDRARRLAAVARTVDGSDGKVLDFLQRVDVAERVRALDEAGERALAQGELGEEGGGALAAFREALELQPAQPRAMQGMAAVESALIRRAEDAAESADFDAALRWLAHAAEVRPDSGLETVADAHARISGLRATRIARLRDLGIAALPKFGGVDVARRHLAEMLRIARPGDPAATELRERITLAVHYGLYAPGQVFTDALGTGGRGPQMAVVPHGAFTMGAPDGEPGASDYERPAHPIRFERGFGMSIREVTVGQFRRFIAATGYRTRAARRGFSMVYDERSGNFVRRSGVDWHSDYLGRPADDGLPVVHVSARDAQAYAEWLATQTGKRYRLPSEAEFEYALRAGGSGRYPWGNGEPPPRAANTTGALDRSPAGKTWTNAFSGYGDGYWGPAPVGRMAPNAWGLHDLAGNVSEWMADCWHDGYRRAPKDGSAWINPGCRDQVIRGGSWASSPAQTRSAWRAPANVDTTNARLGFRVVRDL